MRKLSLRALVPLVLCSGVVAQVGALIGTINVPSGVVPVGLGADPAGDLYLTTTSRTIYKLSSNGTVLQSWSAAANTGISNGVACDGTNVYVTDGSGLPTTGGRGVDVYDLQGNYIRTFPVAATFPAGICIDPLSGNLYVVDRVGTTGVLEYDLLGNQVGTHALNGSASDGITYDPASNTVWVNETAGDTLRNYDSTWTEIGSFPGAVANVGSPGRGVAFVGGILYVVVQASRQIAMFDTTGNFASVATYGLGCPREPIVYELFAQGTIDLSNTSFLFAPNGQGGWAVSQCSPSCFDATIGTNLGLGDDQLAANQQLGFSFPMPGSPHGATAAIDVSSNGFVYLRAGASTSHGCCQGDPAIFLSGPERIAAFWMDLDPTQTGGTYFRSTATKAVITWYRVPEVGLSNLNTAQIQLFPNGSFSLSYQQVSSQAHTVLVGYSSGDNAHDPGSTDLTASIPFSTGVGAARLRLGSERPILGSRLTYRVTQLPLNATLGSIIFGTQQTALPLDGLGLTGCTLLCSGDLAAGPVTLPAGTLQFGIPNASNLIGAAIYHQAVVLAQGLNPFGAITSNGLRFRLGL